MTYLDYAATTPDLTDYAYVQVIKSYFGNPSSSHKYGREARDFVDGCRKNIADYLNCSVDQLIFTSGATESNNMAINGWVKKQTISHILYSPTAHHSMTESAIALKGEPLKVSGEGLIDENYLENYLNDLRQNSMQVLVCLEWVNNETGIIQNIRSIIELCHKYNAMVLVDAVQALPIININLTELQADFVTFSAHKIYGSKGIGLLYCKDLNTLAPLILGGKQEYGLRAGTENVVGIYSFSCAINRLRRDRIDEVAALSELEKTLLKTLVAQSTPFKINGKWGNKSPAILNLNCGVDGSTLVNLLENEDYLVSTGAACDGAEERSHVLMAMGLEDASTTSIRISFSGHFTTKEEVVSFANALGKCIKELQL